MMVGSDEGQAQLKWSASCLSPGMLQYVLYSALPGTIRNLYLSVLARILDGRQHNVYTVHGSPRVYEIYKNTSEIPISVQYSSV